MVDGAGKNKVKFDIGGMICPGSNRQAESGATRKTCGGPWELTMALERRLRRLFLVSHVGRFAVRLLKRVVLFAPSNGVVRMLIVSLVMELLVGGPSMYKDGGYVFHQCTSTVFDMLCVLYMDERMVSGMASCMGTIPPWWYTPIRILIAPLKSAHAIQKRLRHTRDSGMVTQVRMSGIHGRRNRGS